MTVVTVDDGRLVEQLFIAGRRIDGYEKHEVCVVDDTSGALGGVDDVVIANELEEVAGDTESLIRFTHPEATEDDEVDCKCSGG